VSRVAIGMVLERHLPIGALDVLVAGVAQDAEHLVEIASRGHSASVIAEAVRAYHREWPNDRRSRGLRSPCPVMRAVGRNAPPLFLDLLEVGVDRVVASAALRTGSTGAVALRTVVVCPGTLLRRLRVHRLGELVGRLLERGARLLHLRRIAGVEDLLRVVD